VNGAFEYVTFNQDIKICDEYPVDGSLPASERNRQRKCGHFCGSLGNLGIRMTIAMTKYNSRVNTMS